MGHLKTSLPGVDTSTPVVVLKVMRGLFPHGGLNVVRTLGRLGVPVWGFHDDRWAPAALSRYDRGRLIVQLNALAPASALAYLAALGRRLRTRSILIATEDISALFIDDHADVLKRWFIFPEPSAGLPRSLANKQRLYALCKELQIPTPRSAFPSSTADVLAFSQTTSYPVMLKSIDPEVLQSRPQARSTAIAHNPGHLLHLYEQMEVLQWPNLMLQEFIPGDVASHWMVSAYFNEQSDCLAAFSGQKIRESRPGAGFTTLGVCVQNDDVVRRTRNFLKTVGYRGLVDAEWRYDARDGCYKLIDVNPRMGSQFRAFVGVNGIDAVRALYLDLTGQPVPAAAPREGHRWVVENHDLVASLARWRRGDLSLKSWLTSIRGVEEAAWFAKDDQAPFWMMCTRAFVEASRRALTGQRLIRDMEQGTAVCAGSTS
jgi:D-aspartate ligase